MSTRTPDLRKNQFLQKQIKSEMEIRPIDLLTEEEERFCQLFCNGGPAYTGNQIACYKEAFSKGKKEDVMIGANELLTSEAISNRINELMTRNYDNAMYMKMRVIESLSAIMDETRTASYKDKWGIPLSPAPLRAVSVNAAKTIADILGWKKEGGDNNININGENNVTFNVIVPSQK